jgi:glycosyl transferase family 25
VKTYVLGLQDSFRGKSLENFLHNRGLNPEIIYGIDGKDFTEKDLKKIYSSRRAKVIMGRNLANSEIACALGHIEIYKKFIESGDEWALILEDDTYPTNGFVLDKVQFNTLRTPAIVCLQGVEYAMKNRKHLPYLIRSVRDLSPSTGNFFVYEAVGRIHGTFSYLINQKAAELALKKQRRIDSTADWPYAWRDLIKFFITEKMHFDVDLKSSIIDESRREQLITLKPEIGLFRFRLFAWVNTFLGLAGVYSASRFLKGFDFWQDYRERFLAPFLIKRANSDMNWVADSEW